MSWVPGAVTAVEESASMRRSQAMAGTSRHWPARLRPVSSATAPASRLPVESATERPTVGDELYAAIAGLFRAASTELFEDGLASPFADALTAIVRKHGTAAMEVIAHLIVYERVLAEVASEALRWLGRMEHSTTYGYRRWLLERSVRCSSPRVRDGAGLGLAALDDPHAIPYLQQAIRCERCQELRQDLEQALAQLERTHPCRSC